MLPAKQLAIAQGLPDPERFAWHAGLVACFLGGVIEFGCAFFAEKIRRHTPPAAMLATLAGVGLGFLGLAFLFQAFAAPVVGLVMLVLVFVVFFGRVKFRGGLPATVVLLLVGTALAWATGLAPVGGPDAHPLAHLRVYAPLPALGELWAALNGGHIVAYLSVVIPIGLLGVLASLQNIESAAAAGDNYPVKPSLVINGLGTIAAACFGSPFPSSIYIGHPAWKKLGGARRLLRAEWRRHHVRVPDRQHGRADLAHSRRGRHRDHPVDRHDHCRAGFRGDGEEILPRRGGRTFSPHLRRTRCSW